MAEKKFLSLDGLKEYDSFIKGKIDTDIDELADQVAYIDTEDNENIEDVGASNIVVDSVLSTTSTNPVQNKIVTNKFNQLQQEIVDLENSKVEQSDLETEVADQIDGAKVDIVQEVLAQIKGDSNSVFGKVNEDGTITITTDLAEGDYTLMYENEDGSLTEVGTITISGFVVYHSITRTLTKCTSSKSVATIEDGSSWTETITANNGYELSSVTVKMGGVDVTSTVYKNGVVNISKVTGDIVITAIAAEAKPVVVNQIPKSLASTTDTTVYNGTGYKNGVYPSGNDGAITEGTDSTTVLSGYIPYVTTNTEGSVIYMKGVTFSTAVSHNRMVFWTKQGAKNPYIIGNTLISSYFTIEELGTNYYKLTPNTLYIATNRGHLSHIRISATGTGANWIVSIGNPIE